MPYYIVNTDEPISVLIDGKIDEGFLITDEAYVWDGIPRRLITCGECAMWGETDGFPDAKEGTDERKFCPEMQKYPKSDDWCFRAIAKRQ